MQHRERLVKNRRMENTLEEQLPGVPLNL